MSKAFAFGVFEVSEGAPVSRPTPVGIPVSRPEPNSPAALKAQIAELAKLVDEQAAFIRHRDNTIRAFSNDIQSRNRTLDIAEYRIRSTDKAVEAHISRIRSLTGTNERLRLEVSALDAAREADAKRHAEELKISRATRGDAATKFLMQRHLAVQYLYQAWTMLDTIRNTLSYDGETTKEEVVANRKKALAEITG